MRSQFSRNWLLLVASSIVCSCVKDGSGIPSDRGLPSRQYGCFYMFLHRNVHTGKVDVGMDFKQLFEALPVEQAIE